MNPIQVAALAHDIADRAVIADIETECVAVCDETGRCWWDTRVMLDPREMPDDCIEMNRQALDYAAQRGLITRHQNQTYLVRITPQRPA